MNILFLDVICNFRNYDLIFGCKTDGSIIQGKNVKSQKISKIYIYKIFEKSRKCKN